jgi:hypothetical protein
LTTAREIESQVYQFFDSRLSFVGSRSKSSAITISEYVGAIGR